MDTISIGKIKVLKFHGHNSVKNVGGVIFLFSAYRLMVYICTKFHETILNGMKLIEWTQFP